MAEDLRIQFLRGNFSQNLYYTGADGELTVDTQQRNLHLHDGVNAGGATFESVEFLAATNTALGCTLYVDNVNGNDATALRGSATHPFKTVMAALDAIPRNTKDVILHLRYGQTHVYNAVRDAPKVRENGHFHINGGWGLPDGWIEDDLATLQMIPSNVARNTDTNSYYEYDRWHAWLLGGHNYGGSLNIYIGWVKIKTGVIPQAAKDRGESHYGWGYGGFISRGHRHDVYLRSTVVEVEDIPFITTEAPYGIQLKSTVIRKTGDAPFFDGASADRITAVNGSSQTGFDSWGELFTNRVNNLDIGNPQPVNVMGDITAVYATHHFKNGVISFGDNTNGRYWRYAGGLQVCLKTWVFTFNDAADHDIAGGTLSKTKFIADDGFIPISGNWPAQFSEIPGISISAGQQNHADHMLVGSRARPSLNDYGTLVIQFKNIVTDTPDPITTSNQLLYVTIIGQGMFM